MTGDGIRPSGVRGGNKDEAVMTTLPRSSADTDVCRKRAMGPVGGFAPGRAEGYYKPVTIPSVRACPLCVIPSSSSSAAVSTVDDAQGAAGRAGDDAVWGVALSKGCAPGPPWLSGLKFNRV
jgi:hypothetical protein